MGSCCCRIANEWTKDHGPVCDGLCIHLICRTSPTWKYMKILDLGSVVTKMVLRSPTAYYLGITANPPNQHPTCHWILGQANSLRPFGCWTKMRLAKAGNLAMSQVPISGYGSNMITFQVPSKLQRPHANRLSGESFQTYLSNLI